MAIEKSNFKASRLDSEFSPGSRDSMSSDEDDLRLQSSAVESDDDDEFDDADSGAGSDDFDLLELGETGAEFCQVENQTCSVPFELYDLPGLEDILSVDVWNDCLTDEDRFNLSSYLPDMDQETFMLTLTELFSGANFHFGSPVKCLFDMLKGGLCEPRVALYRQGLSFFQKRHHYHHLRNYHNGMVANLNQLRDAWLNCRGYSIEEKLQVLNIMKSQNSLMYEKMDALGSDSSEREDLGGGLWGNKLKDKKMSQKLGRHLSYGMGTNSEFSLLGRPSTVVPVKYGKQNPKSMLKLSGSKALSTKDLTGGFPSVQYMDMKSGPYGSAVALPRQNKSAGYDSGGALRIRDQMIIDDDDDDDDADASMYGMGYQRAINSARVEMTDRAGVLKARKRHGMLRGDEFTDDSYTSLPLSSKREFLAYGRNRNVSQLTEVKVPMVKPHNTRAPYDYGKKAKYPGNNQHSIVGDQTKYVKGQTSQSLLKNQVDSAEQLEPSWLSKTQGVAFSLDPSSRYDDWHVRGKKWKAGRDSPDLNYKTYGASSPQISDRFLQSELRAKFSQEKVKSHILQNGGADMSMLKSNRMVVRTEETESDSSEQLGNDEDDEDDMDYEANNPLMRSKSAYPSRVMDSSRISLGKSGLDVKKSKPGKKDMKESARALDRTSYLSNMGGLDGNVHIPEAETYSSKAKQKGKIRDGGSGSNSARGLDDSIFPLAKFNDDEEGEEDDGDNKKVHKLGKNGRALRDSGERVQISSLKPYPTDRKHKSDLSRKYPARHESYFHDNGDEEDDSFETHMSTDIKGPGRLRRKSLVAEAHVNDHEERPEGTSIGPTSVLKKRKGKGALDMDGREDNSNQQSDAKLQIDGSTSVKKRGKRKLEADTGAPDIEGSEPPGAEIGATNMELETKPQKKPFILITPTVHTGFSFSVIHLLSAVRMAMIAPLPEDSLIVGNPREEMNKNNDGSANGVLSNENLNVDNPDHSEQANGPSLTVLEIVNRVRSNPGDPSILETQEPLQDLVRGVLKILSSRTAPLGAKGWKVLVVYEKPTKSWSWVGPVSHSSSEHETVEEVTSPEAWDLPHKMLVKLVDSFANWLKSGQETLQQIGSLPSPPLALMQVNMDEKERFRDHRAQRSLSTISPSSEEVKNYFRKEELLRYSIPDRAFCYTAADGKKSIVAPLRRCGGKPTSKARDHFMLKRDRPPHVTILCLVRDSAARLPGSIGTRADVCTLIRDSQYIVEDVSDAQVNQVVSGALDRLHYERDPCVQYDAERKLWVYLHREREEEDFEDDGTSSTKKWKRPKKEAAEQSDQGTVTVAYHGIEQTGFDLRSDLNVEPLSMDDDKGEERGYDDLGQNVEENMETSHGSEQGTQQGNPMVWEGLNLNPNGENKLLCQENSKNEDFEVELSSAGLL